MVHQNVFIWAFIFAAVWLSCSKANLENNDVFVLERLKQLELELYETRISTEKLTIELQDFRIVHAKTTEKLTRELRESRIEHARATKELKNELSETRAELNAIKSIFSESASKLHGLNESSIVHNMPNAALARASRQTGTYAFTAYLDHTIQHLGIDQTIIFNQVHLNTGNAYNRFTGIFTCPVDGTYVFSFFVANIYRKQVVAELVMDGTKILHAIADTEYQSDMVESQGGNVAALYCRQGSGVRVTNVRYADRQVMGDDDTSRFTSFSGFILN